MNTQTQWLIGAIVGLGITFAGGFGCSIILTPHQWMMIGLCTVCSSVGLIMGYELCKVEKIEGVPQ